MADLLVHYTAAHVLGKPMRDRRLRVIFYLGNCVPDLLYKTFYYLTASPGWYEEPTHSPLMLVVASYALALLFEERLRRAAFGLLLAGSLCHVLIDFGKNYMGMGVILWAFPFSMDTAELGWYHTEESLLAWPWCVAILAVTEGAWWAVRKARSGKPTGQAG